MPVESTETRRYGRIHLIAGIIIGALMCGWSGMPARAAGTPPPRQCRQALQKVLMQNDFGQKKTVYRWERIRKKKTDSWLNRLLKGLSSALDAMAAFFKQWTGPLATVCEGLLWILAGSGGVWLIYRYTHIQKWLANAAGKPPAGGQPAPVLFGLAVTPESLPDDIPGSCRRLLTDGKPRQALALLYRATLSRILHVHGLPVPAAATEMECRQLVASHRPAGETELFNHLTACWLNTAYGHRHPGRDRIDTLIDRWDQMYDGEGDAHAAG